MKRDLVWVQVALQFQEQLHGIVRTIIGSGPKCIASANIEPRVFVDALELITKEIDTTLRGSVEQ